MYVLIENISAVRLPSGPMPKTATQRMYSLQRRSHVVYEDPARPGLKPLDDDEREELGVLEEQWRDARMPKFGDALKFPFEPHGRDGSVWKAFDNEAQVLMTQHPTRLRVLDAGEAPRVQPRDHNWRPSIKETTPCSTTEEASFAATKIGEHGQILGAGWMVGAVASAGSTER